MTEHSSDCALHNEPAEPAGPCSCMADPRTAEKASNWPIFTTTSGQKIAFNMERAFTVHEAPSGATIDFGNDYYITVAESFGNVVTRARSQA